MDKGGRRIKELKLCKVVKRQQAEQGVRSVMGEKEKEIDKNKVLTRKYRCPEYIYSFKTLITIVFVYFDPYKKGVSSTNDVLNYRTEST